MCGTQCFLGVYHSIHTTVLTGKTVYAWCTVPTGRRANVAAQRQAILKTRPMSALTSPCFFFSGSQEKNAERAEAPVQRARTPMARRGRCPRSVWVLKSSGGYRMLQNNSQRSKRVKERKAI